MAENHYSHAEARERLALATWRALNRFALLTMGESQREAPIEEGTLRGSATIDEMGGPAVQLLRAGEGGRVEVRIVYPLIYAQYQHEGHRADGSYVIQNHPKGGKTHFLEDPLKAHAHELPAIIAQAQRAALK